MKLARKSINIGEYKAKLFDKRRMEQRFHIFSSITIPSLCAQNACESNIYHLILVSDELPGDERIRLDDLLSRFSDTCVSPVVATVAAKEDSVDEASGIYDSVSDAITLTITGIIGKKSGSHGFATVRLDDDDAVSPGYCSSLSKYITNAMIGMPVTFPLGISGLNNEEEGFSHLKLTHDPFVTPGLSYINAYERSSGFKNKKIIHVHNLGNHKEIEWKTPFITDTSFIAYFRTLHKHNDSGIGINSVFGYHPDATLGEIRLSGFSFLNNFSLPDMEPTRGKGVMVLIGASREEARLKKQRHDIEKGR